LLSVALVLNSRWTDVIRYATLWCPDFPLHLKWSDKTTYLTLQKYAKNCVKKTHSQYEWENCYEKEKVLLDISLITFVKYIYYFLK